MNFFGFTPDLVAARVKLAGDEPRIPTLTGSILVGSLGLGLTSTGIFTLIHFGNAWLSGSFGKLGPYLLATALFIALAGGSLSRLVIGPGRVSRFYLLFSVAFSAYAACWTAAYIAIRGFTGEFVGSLVGTVLMALILAGAFGAMESAGRLVLVLVATNLAGYFLGRAAFFQCHGGALGIILFGVIYGFAFGAGLGYVLYLAQEPVRRRLSAIPGFVDGDGNRVEP